jgi:hypothetical protein
MKFTLSDDDEEIFWYKMETVVADAIKKGQIQKKLGGYSNGEIFRMVFRDTRLSVAPDPNRDDCITLRLPKDWMKRPYIGGSIG